jgi:hypothetical protein
VSFLLGEDSAGAIVGVRVGLVSTEHAQFDIVLSCKEGPDPSAHTRSVCARSRCSMGTSSCSDLCGATKKESFLAHIMLIVRVYRVIHVGVLKSVVPLGRGAKDAEVEIEFGNAESVGTDFLECSDNLLVFVAVRVHWEALYTLKNEAEGYVGFGKVENVPP